MPNHVNENGKSDPAKSKTAQRMRLKVIARGRAVPRWTMKPARREEVKMRKTGKNIFGK
jgi:hypothetical protein